MYHGNTANTELSNPAIESKLIDTRNRLRNPIAFRESEANRDLRGN